MTAQEFVDRYDGCRVRIHGDEIGMVDGMIDDDEVQYVRVKTEKLPFGGGWFPRSLEIIEDRPKTITPLPLPG